MTFDVCFDVADDTQFPQDGVSSESASTTDNFRQMVVTPDDTTYWRISRQLISTSPAKFIHSNLAANR